MTQVPQAVIWLVSAVLVEAAVIDGRQLRVPNWLTFHFALGGLVFAAWSRRPGGVFSGRWRGRASAWFRYCLSMRSAAWERVTSS